MRPRARRHGLSELAQGSSHRGAFLLAGPRRIAGIVARRLDPPTRMRRGDWMQLLPIAAAPRGPLGWLESAGDVVLRTPIGCFAPILFGTVDPERLSSLAALCDASREMSHAGGAAHPAGPAR